MKQAATNPPDLSLPERNQTFRLASGRRLGWAEFGDPAGFPVFYFHGLPGSRLEAALTHTSALRRRVRVLAVDRPGFGLSEFEPNRRMLDWPERVAELADRLELDRFSIIGVSGGAPYASVCALRLADRLQAVGLVCGMAPLEQARYLKGIKALPRFFLTLHRQFPGLGEVICRQTARVLVRHPDKAFSVIARTSSPPDQEVLAQPQVFATMTESLREAVRQGGQGAARDLILFGNDWGFSLEEIQTQVFLWHGERDFTLPADFSRRVAARIPHSRITILPDQGHFSLPINFVDDFIQAVSG
ncbi:MAG: alpha/beta hydrolase [Blastocatellia bacterium]|nr:alpha/beta hydrolase [Blastocatellia bacterium]